MEGSHWIITESFYLGPLLLWLGGVILNYLKNPSPVFRGDYLFFGTELSLSSLGSALGAVVNLAATPNIDGFKVVTLLGLIIYDLFTVAMLVCVHKALEGYTSRPKVRLYVLAGPGNLLPLAGLIATLYFIKPVPVLVPL